MQITDIYQPVIPTQLACCNPLSADQMYPAISVPKDRIGSGFWRSDPDSTRLDPMIQKIISRSSDPISAIVFLLCSSRRPRQNKSKIAYIGPVDHEKIVKNDFLLSLHICPN